MAQVSNLFHSSCMISTVIFLLILPNLNSIRLNGSKRYPNIRGPIRHKPTRKPTIYFNPIRPNFTEDTRPNFENRWTFPPTPPPKQTVTVGLVLPPTNFRKRDYVRKIRKAISDYRIRNNNSIFVQNYEFGYENVVQRYMEASSSPTTILSALCNDFLGRRVSAILYLFNLETFGRSTASAQYFFQLASYLGIPVISWNADNSGLEMRTSSLQLQLAPSIEHQASAMLSILRRYSWAKFAIVTSRIAGHNDFVQAVRDLLHQEEIDNDSEEQRLQLLETFIIHSVEDDMKKVADSEARIFLLYCTRMEAAHLMEVANNLTLTGKNYLWIATQSVIQSITEAPKELPVGMLGVHFGTSDDSMIEEIETTLAVFAHGTANYIADESIRNANPNMSPYISCDSGNARWQEGSQLFRFLKNVRINLDNDKKKPNLEFNADGTRKSVELKIMNLRPDQTKQLFWEEIGTWYSWRKEGLEVKDIIWPGYSHVPPNGIPEKFHLKVTFMEELPFISMDPPHPVTGTCPANKGILCRVATDEMMAGVNLSMAMRNSSYYQCCSGFCIDFLVQLSKDLGFSYEFTRVEDGIWGAIVKGKWTGLPGAIINGKADMIMTSIKINSQREEVLDFSIPFLDTGITMIVSKRTGIISATAFLEPFDTASWLLVAAVAIQVAAFSIFIFEWLSPHGFNMKFRPAPGQRFSLLRTLWLVWAILFQAAVNIDVPRSITGRVMGNVWAMFALIFLAIYTANLAAFMITREEFYALSGLEDEKLQNPTSMKPPFRFATTLHGNTDVLIKKSYPAMHSYMRQYNQSSPIEGVKAVKKGTLDAFLYDATALEYLTGQDDECRLLTVGSWFALTGYGVAFPRNSKYIPLFNEQIMKYRANGYLERLTRFWFTGACKPERQYKSSSKPLSLEQFMSTFILLGCGIILGFIILSCEHFYFKKGRPFLAKTKLSKFFSLFSMSMGRSLDSRVSGPEDNRQTKVDLPCENPLCDMDLWQIKHDLDLANIRIYYLKKQLISTGIWKNTMHHNETSIQSNENSSENLGSDAEEMELEFPKLKTIKWTLSNKNVKNHKKRKKPKISQTSKETEIIRQPLLSNRNPTSEVAEKETVL